MLTRVLSLFALGTVLTGPPASAVTIDWVLVGDPGNAPDTPSSNCYSANCGSVADAFLISKYEVTNAQYAEFLNAKAASDPNGLYSTSMGSSAQGGITRSGTSGIYTYAVKAGFADKPVNFVTFWDAARFTNWLNNGQGTGDTETGAYTITTAGLSANSITRNANANIFLPSESEWYKAAYYDALTATYFDYPAGTNAVTLCAAPTGTANRANCNGAAGPPYLADVGAYTGSASPSGTFDQGGNVFEWNETIVNGLIVSGSFRGIRGGDWSSDFMFLAASDWEVADPAYAIDSDLSVVGFRVASVVPEPGTIALVMTGLACLGLQRRRV